ncbi:hypothetical protein JR316_0008370 [Psilocybe cubensis]|uniref:Uncharacterized protein n=2 Tax=Psilocybe cubensis TaxID=181762 RepID=A0ACB8GWC5_PSICU|nr:hypothetical protein JR316_0008370 [Psilocybe cubensis]KAH9479775.1 hypothetical protein JR316_0008370 [Psilocybe cubensis]
MFAVAKSHAKPRCIQRLVSTASAHGSLSFSTSFGVSSGSGCRDRQGAGEGVGCTAKARSVQRRRYTNAAAAADSTSKYVFSSTSKGSSASTSTSTPVDLESRQTFATQKQKQKKLKADVCALLRDVAQPVAVVTSIKSPSLSSSRSASVSDADDPELSLRSAVLPEYHGATLSSFTSIAMDPYPLVAFALRIPSRMASALTTMAEAQESSGEGEEERAHMVINLLAASQAQTAFTFSRPDLHPTPFSNSGRSKLTRYTLSADGLPVIDGSVGALSCRLVGRPIPLYDLNYLEQRQRKGEAVMPPLRSEKGEVASELFIARVVRVEPVQGEGVVDAEAEAEAEERPLPLVYHRRSYTTCTPKS